MKSFVYIETKNGKPLGSSLELLTLASSLGESTAVLAGSGLAEAAALTSAYGTSVLVADGSAACPDETVSLLEQLIRDNTPELVLFSATQSGKDYAPRLAQRLGGGCVTDATSVELTDAGLSFTRPAFGGSVLETMTAASGLPCFATVRSGCYARPAVGESAAVTTVALSPAADAVKARVLEVVTELTEQVDLEGADIIVAGGRGMGNAEDFKLVEELAALLGGVVGATRPAIEEGWIPRSHQIGQSGKTVAPKLYIACGISGAMQHISGAMGSKYIVAINKDEDASIFRVADVGIVGDVKAILPLMIEEIRKRKEA